jgi:integrase
MTQSNDQQPNEPTKPRRECGRGRIFARKGSALLWCAYYLNGKEYRQSTATGDPKEAEKFLKRKLKDRDAADDAKPFVSPQQDRVLVNTILDDLVAEYKLGGKRQIPREVSPPMQSQIKRLREYFGTMRAMQVHRRDVIRFISTLRAEGKKNATINRLLQLLEQAYKVAVTADPPVLSRMLIVPMQNESDNVRKGKFTNEEAEAIFAGLPNYMMDFARFAYETGARSGEIKKLRWTYLNGDAISVPASACKNRKTRSIVLTPPLAEIIERRRAAQISACDLIFHNAGRAIGDYRHCWQTACALNGLGFYCRHCKDADNNFVSVLDVKRVCPQCGKTCRAPKYIGRIFHDFRRSAAHELWKAGNSMQDCMEVTGHSTEAMFKRYADLFSEEEKQARQPRAQQRRYEVRTEQLANLPVATTLRQ